MFHSLIIVLPCAAFLSCCEGAHFERSAFLLQALHPKSVCLIQQRSQLKESPRRFSANGSSSALLRQSRVAMTSALRWSLDVFGEDEDIISGAKNDSLLLSTWSTGEKVSVCAAVVLMATFDHFVLQRFGTVGLRSHLLLVAFWVAIGMIWSVVIWHRKGNVAGIEWTSGYALEWLLSMDNLFVFHLIFRLHGAPKDVMHKALFCGIVGAVASRLLFFSIVGLLLQFISAFRFIFGAFLIWSAVQALQEGEETDESSLSDIAPVRLLRRCLGSRLLDSYGEEARVVVCKDDKLHFTLLLPLIVSLEFTDVVFALDSVSAKAAQIPDYWICCSSSIVAMFGLRAMFFVVKDLVDYFDLLKYGLCFILAFIGIELMIADFVQLPPQVVLVVILAVFIISIAGSAIRQKDAEGGAAPVDQTAPGDGLLNAVPAKAA
eukprot:gb/GFBE01041362.1/.p1 GENE.gb/GFBE01041362.1/~~gb/GFBE01041362.1/.p1  ORF type:complete len:433 (+),score=105.33 gb/GFBE01041362.1/:1-1299(+)